ncbi:hypothetical protein BDV12DRAFT_105268 [Aspergillus spectabilis]
MPIIGRFPSFAGSQDNTQNTRIQLQAKIWWLMPPFVHWADLHTPRPSAFCRAISDISVHRLHTSPYTVHTAYVFLAGSDWSTTGTERYNVTALPVRQNFRQRPSCTLSPFRPEHPPSSVSSCQPLPPNSVVDFPCSSTEIGAPEPHLAIQECMLIGPLLFLQHICSSHRVPRSTRLPPG